MPDTLVKVEGVSKKFCRSLKRSLWYGLQDLGSEIVGHRHGDMDSLRPDEFWAVRNVSFELKRGECLGLVGRNGAGKTTLLRMLNGLIKPDAGRIEMHGRLGALIALGAGFNPILTGRENIYINASVLGLSKREVNEKIDEIIDFAELGEFIDTPVQNYSSGMQVRLGFAVATTLQTDVLLLDEVLAVGDVAFRSKCFDRIGKLINRCAVIFVSHDQTQISRICDFCLYLRDGVPQAFGQAYDVLSEYSKKNLKPAVSRSVVLHPTVTKFVCKPAVTHIHWGEMLHFVIEVDCSEDFKSGLALLALHDSEIPVAQAEFTQILNNSPKKNHEISVKLGPLHLKAGDYGLAVTILSENKKSTIIHAINCAIIHVKGRNGYGVCYQMPCSF